MKEELMIRREDKQELKGREEGEDSQAWSANPISVVPNSDPPSPAHR